MLKGPNLQISQGPTKSEAIMGVILALPFYFQRMSYLHERIVQY